MINKLLFSGLIALCRLRGDSIYEFEQHCVLKLMSLCGISFRTWSWSFSLRDGATQLVTDDSEKVEGLITNLWTLSLWSLHVLPVSRCYIIMNVMNVTCVCVRALDWLYHTCVFLSYGACKGTSHHLSPHHNDLSEILGLKSANSDSQPCGRSVEPEKTMKSETCRFVSYFRLSGRRHDFNRT